MSASPGGAAAEASEDGRGYAFGVLALFILILLAALAYLLIAAVTGSGTAALIALLIVLIVGLVQVDGGRWIRR